MRKIGKEMRERDCKKSEMGIRFKIFRNLIDREKDQLAKEMETSRGEIEDIEEGKIYPNIAYLYYLHETYGLNINWLLGKVGNIFHTETPGSRYYQRPYPLPGAKELDKEELLELMEIPLIRDSIMATLLEITTLLKQQMPSASLPKETLEDETSPDNQ